MENVELECPCCCGKFKQPIPASMEHLRLQQDHARVKSAACDLAKRLSEVTSCMVGLDAKMPKGRVYVHLADDTMALLEKVGPSVGLDPAWWGGKRPEWHS